MRFCSFLGPAPVQEGIEGSDESRTVPRGEGPSDSQALSARFLSRSLLSWLFALNISPRVALDKLSLGIAQIQFFLEILLLSRLKINFTARSETHNVYGRQSLSRVRRVSVQIPSKRSGWCPVTLSLTIIISLPKKKKRKKKRRIKEERQIFDHLDARI